MISGSFHQSPALIINYNNWLRILLSRDMLSVEENHSFIHAEVQATHVGVYYILLFANSMDSQIHLAANTIRRVLASWNVFPSAHVMTCLSQKAALEKNVSCRSVASQTVNYS